MNMNIMNAGDYGRMDMVRKDLKKTERKETARTDAAKSAGENDILKTNESKLSSKAQEFLKGLREQYGDYDFLVGNKTDDLKSLAKSGSKEFSVIFSNEELERMADDESYAREKMEHVQTAVEMSERICKEFGFERGQGIGSEGSINKLAVSFDDDGTMSIFAELEKSSEKQRERIEKAREQRTEEKKEADKAKVRNPYENKDGIKVKKATIEASSEEELMEKLRDLDWSTIAEERRTSGDRFNFAI